MRTMNNLDDMTPEELLTLYKKNKSKIRENLSRINELEAELQMKTGDSRKK